MKILFAALKILFCFGFAVFMILRIQNTKEDEKEKSQLNVLLLIVGFIIIGVITGKIQF